MMPEKYALVLTSINPPNKVMQELANGAASHGYEFFIIGDRKSPGNFSLGSSRYYSLEQQLESGLSFAQACPENHYARKNVGYLLAIRNGATIIVETDDDNFPNPAFFSSRKRQRDARKVSEKDWVNLYRYFSDSLIWPRGFPLDRIKDLPLKSYDEMGLESVDCPIQQGLADENPDVDAVFRLTQDLPQTFEQGREVAAGQGCWCPFNSQNTVWWSDAFPLLYLPSYCSFRMTDIWRSLIAQRIAWTNNWQILFYSPTVWQERNPHDLIKDFADEVPGYLNNVRIQETLDSLRLDAGVEFIPDNLRKCYDAMVGLDLVGKDELVLLDKWLEDLVHLSTE